MLANAFQHECSQNSQTSTLPKQGCGQVWQASAVASRERNHGRAGSYWRSQIADYSLLRPLVLGSVVEHISGRSGAMI
jgi:hypothetical protein